MSDERILKMERILAAPCERVFEAWTRPELIARWWGGWGAGDAPRMESDAIDGGRWRFAMRLNDSTAWMGGRYTEVVPHSRLAFSFAWEGQEMPETPVVLDFEDLEDGRTRLTLTHDLTLGDNACGEGWDAQLRPLSAFVSQVA
jgi:uncharacterized protein YndB with AHSA1/START domain